MKAVTLPINTAQAAPPRAVRVNRVSWQNGKLQKSDYDLVASEQPLQVIIFWPSADNNELKQHVFTITMRTTGDDFELVTGLLYCEGIITQSKDIVSIEHSDDNQVQVTLSTGIAKQIQSQLTASNRQLFSNSSCGICGKTSLKALELQSNIKLDESQSWLTPEQICQLPEKLRNEQNLFAQTGSVHGAALFTEQYHMVDYFEDIGRHNALDKLIGKGVLTSHLNKPNKNILVLSGRVSFELIQKALMAGYPVCVAVGAPSSLAIEAAIRFDMTLIGFTKTDGFNIYSGQWRLAYEL